MASKLGSLFVGVFAIVVISTGAADAQSKCSSVKVKAAGKKAAAKLGCLAKGVGKALAVDSTCLAKTEIKFSSIMAKSEAKMPISCLTFGDTAAIEAKVDALYADIDALVMDNAGGTPHKCDSTKVKAAAKKSAAKLNCWAKAVAKNLAIDSACIAKAEIKFSVSAAKAEAKVPTDCTATGDYAQYEALIDATVIDVASELSAPCPSFTSPANCGNCCDDPQLQFTIGVGTGNCGAVYDARSYKLLDLTCSGLYFGGAGVSVPLPSTIPDMGVFITEITNCSPSGGTYDLAASTAAQSGSVRTCTKAGEANGYPRTGCLFAAPLAVPNATTSATSTCVINRITSDATGAGTCAGRVAASFDLGSDLYLTGDLLPGESGINPCPLCLGPSGSETCVGGPNNGLACTPSTSELGEGYPTTHDCPPPEANFIGTLPIPFALTTGGAFDVAAATDSQTEVFCGFCRSTIAPNPFQTPPQPCTATADCTTAPFTRCEQRNEGAFGQGVAHAIAACGVEATPCLTGNAQRASTLASVFCIPPSYNGLVDGAADLPGPGAVTLPGTMEMLP